MVWDGDINPEGLSQQWKHTFNLSCGGGRPLRRPRNTARMERAWPRLNHRASTMTIDVFANLGQFVYDDKNPENPLGPPTVSGGRFVPDNDAWIFGWQLGAKLNFTRTTYFQLAPTIYNYSGTGTL